MLRLEVSGKMVAFLKMDRNTETNSGTGSEGSVLGGVGCESDCSRGWRSGEGFLRTQLLRVNCTIVVEGGRSCCEEVEGWQREDGQRNREVGGKTNNGAQQSPW